MPLPVRQMLLSSFYQVRSPMFRECKQPAWDHRGLHSKNICMAKFTSVENHSFRLLHDQSLNRTHQQMYVDCGVLTPRPDSLSYFSNLRQNARTPKRCGYSSTLRPCSVWGSKGRACFPEHISHCGCAPQECPALPYLPCPT